MNDKLNPRSNEVSDELTFNADDNEHTSESPMKTFQNKGKDFKTL